MTNRYDHSGSERNEGLSLERLARIISAYGANPTRWPADMRTRWPKDISMNAELRAHLGDEAALDEALDSVRPVEVPARLREQLLTGFERFIEQDRARISRRIGRRVASLRESIWPGAAWWQPAFALSLSILVGVSAGLLIPDSLSGGSDQQVASVLDAPTPVDIGPDQ